MVRMFTLLITLAILAVLWSEHPIHTTKMIVTQAVPLLVLILGLSRLFLPWLICARQRISLLRFIILVSIVCALYGWLIEGSWLFVLKWLGCCLLIILLMHYLNLYYHAYSPALVEAQLIALTARIRPHFLFNALNTAISLVHHKPEQAEDVLHNLSDLFRAHLSESKAQSTLQEEIELAQNYLAIEHLRLGERLKVDWHVSAPAQAIIPPLTLQPLLENAVHHGIEGLPHGGTIKIHITRVKRQLVIDIENSRQLHSEQHKQGHKIALNNLRQRFKLLFGSEAVFKVNDQQAHMFKIRIIIPCRKALKV